MFGKIKRTISLSVALINVIAVIAMIVTGYGGYVDPVSHHYIAVFTLAFPAFLITNILFLMFWIIFKFRFVLISLTGFIVCYQPIRTYCPINTESEIPSDAIKFMSFNVCVYREYDFPKDKNPIIKYLKENDADIICLQEAMRSVEMKNVMDKELTKSYPYQDYFFKNGGGQAILSKFPIISLDSINYKSDSNRSIAWKLDVNGDTVLVINNHFESNKLSDEDRKKFKNLVKQNINDKDAKDDTKWLINKLASATKIRGPQADSVANYIKKNSRLSTIVCGDFNDNPLSYVRRKVGENLTDCYVEKGCGPGISYHTGGFYVRIDNIMCSPDWDVYKCKIDSEISISDHYPIYTWIKKRYKQ